MNNPSDPHPAALAKALEERGFESLWYGEHSHIPSAQITPYPPGGEMPDPYKCMMDPYLSLMLAASATRSLRLGTGIALLMERDLFAQAKTIATLDRLSNGRVIIGTGVGWNQEAFENSNPHPFNKRYAVLRETVEATRTLWREEEPAYHGKYIKFDPVWSDPKPLQIGGPKILMGAMGPLGRKHAAAWADGWGFVDVDFLTRLRDGRSSLPRMQADMAMRGGTERFGPDPFARRLAHAGSNGNCPSNIQRDIFRVAEDHPIDQMPFQYYSGPARLCRPHETIAMRIERDGLDKYALHLAFIRPGDGLGGLAYE